MSRVPVALLLAVLTGALAPGCEDTRLRQARNPDVYVDTYAQRTESKVDVLWIVDNSGWMNIHQDNLARNFDAFIRLFVQGRVDYRIAVTTTDIFKDQGKFLGNPAILTPHTPNVVEAFGRNIRVGISGSAHEVGLEAARMSLERQATKNADSLKQIEDCQFSCPGGANRQPCLEGCGTQFPVDFLRPDAFLYLVFVSDEEDKSRYDVRYYWRWFQTVKGAGNDGMVGLAGIVGRPGESCALVPGLRYLEVVELSGGQAGDICDENFAQTLRKLSTSAVGLRRKFALSRAPNVQTIDISIRYPCNTIDEVLEGCAAVDRSECEGVPSEAVALVCKPVQGGPDGWHYEPPNHVIFFSGESVPGLGSQLEIEYYPEGKP
jgi:hypothetical protein